MTNPTQSPATPVSPGAVVAGLPDLIHAVINATRADEHAFHEWVRGGITDQEREAAREAFTVAVTAVLAAARAIEAVGS